MNRLPRVFMLLCLVASVWPVAASLAAGSPAQGQAAAQTFGEAYRRMTEQAKGSAGGAPVQEIVPVIIGGLIVLDILIWGCVFTDCI